MSTASASPPTQQTRTNAKSTHARQTLLTSTRAYVRPSLNNERWACLNEGLNREVTTFTKGLMTGPTVKANIQPLRRNGLRTFQITGPIKWTNTEHEIGFGAEVKYAQEVEHVEDMGHFQICKTNHVVQSPDFVLLLPAGRIQFGWKERPVGAPDIAAA